MLFLIFIVIMTPSCEEENGCTNPNADNFNPEAEFDDGSCDFTQWSLLAQNELDLCGIWLGYGYNCHIYLPLVEVILIEDLGGANSFIRATKIIGDGCVCDGEVTFEGNYVSNPFNIQFYLGGGCGTAFPSLNAELEIITPNQIVTSAGIELIRATNEQINNLNLGIDVENFCKPHN